MPGRKSQSIPDLLRNCLTAEQDQILGWVAGCSVLPDKRLISGKAIKHPDEIIFIRVCAPEGR
ncbi:MAG: hypothetical protein AAGD25_19375, partial [Cyanobacteria bacterium P01_F01_bin.150]